MNSIKLEFDKTVTRLAGYKYGKSVYDAQCKEIIQFDDKIILEFPINIQKLASSFIQGFFNEIIEKIGIAGVENQVEIISANDNMKKEIIDNLF